MTDPVPRLTKPTHCPGILLRLQGVEEKLWDTAAAGDPVSGKVGQSRIDDIEKGMFGIRHDIDAIDPVTELQYAEPTRPHPAPSCC